MTSQQTKETKTLTNFRPRVKCTDKSDLNLVNEINEFLLSKAATKDFKVDLLSTFDLIDANITLEHLLYWNTDELECIYELTCEYKA